MQLHIDSDAAYLVAPKVRSRIVGFYYFKYAPNGKILTSLNQPILIECHCLQHVVSSAAEAETAALFHNSQNSLLLRRILVALGHSQSPTPIKTDNAIANNFVHNNMHLRKSKTWNIRFYWLHDHETQRHIKVHWKRGLDETDPNFADYHTKHHSTIHHRGIRPLYVRDKIIRNIATINNTSSELRGCIILSQDLIFVCPSTGNNIQSLMTLSLT